MPNIWQRLQRSSRALVMVRGEDPFFALFVLERRSASEFLVEVTFSPEVATMGGVETDVIVTWGSIHEICDWVDSFSRSMSFELAPKDREQELVRHYFEEPRERIAMPDVANPWSTY